MARIAFATLIVWCLSALSAPAEPVVREIRLSPEGNILAIVVTVYEYDIIVDKDGAIQGVEIIPGATGVDRYDIDKKKMRGRKICDFSNGRLLSIDDAAITYQGAESNRVLSIGKLGFAFRTVAGKPERLEKIGCIELKYDETNNRIEDLGNIQIRYDYESKRILSLVVRSGQQCVATVRIYNPVANFK